MVGWYGKGCGAVVVVVVVGMRPWLVAYVEDVEVEDEEDAADVEEALDGRRPVELDGEDGGVDLQVVQELREAE
jgi:hypothetical protein